MRAVLAQTRKPDELIVVDDASTDDSLARVKRLLAEPDAVPAAMHIELLPLPRNGGPGNARNRGLELAGGDYVQLLDADDRLYPTCLERVADVLVQHEPDFLILGYRRSGDGAARPTLADLPPGLETLADGLYRLANPVAAIASDGIGIIGSNLVCRRERLDGLTYDTEAHHFEGVDFWYRCFASAPDLRVLLLDEPCMDYLELPDGLLSRKADRASEITVPVLLRRLQATTDPEARAMRRRLARAGLRMRGNGYRIGARNWRSCGSGAVGFTELAAGAGLVVEPPLTLRQLADHAQSFVSQQRPGIDAYFPVQIPHQVTCAGTVDFVDTIANEVHRTDTQASLGRHPLGVDDIRRHFGWGQAIVGKHVVIRCEIGPASFLAKMHAALWTAPVGDP